MILILYATFVPNLMFLGLLSLEISFEEKTVTHPPNIFCHPWISVLRTKEKLLGNIDCNKGQQNRAMLPQFIPLLEMAP